MTPVIEIKNLQKYFKTPKGELHAVDNVSMTFERGKTMGVVGESGCGKSTLGRTIIHLHESTGGQIFYNGKDITRVKSRELNELRSRLQIIFQDPYSSLNPRMTVEETIKEPLYLSGQYTGAEMEKEITRLMDLVGIAQRMRMAYPHELDGGRRQRVGIGRALALNPEFIVCDEPVSALDVSIQAQILNLMQDVQKQMGLTYLFITHDLSVVKHFSDEILVMYLGQMVEKCSSKRLFENPMHPYTQALLSAIPVPDPHVRMQKIPLKGELSSPINPPAGCRFAKRCPYACAACTEKSIPLREVEPNHFVACIQAGEISM